MIKALTYSRDGDPVVLLGLSKANLERLPRDEPIKVDLASMGLPPMTVVIFAGETEEQMTTDLYHMFTKGTPPEEPEDHLVKPADKPIGIRALFPYYGKPCPDAPHRGPEGPDEDVAQCPKCGALSHGSRSR